MSVQASVSSRSAFDFFEGYMVTAVLAALEMGGLLDRLAGDGIDPRSVKDREGGLLLEASLRYLVQRGLVEEERGSYALTSLGRDVYGDRGYLVWLGGGYAEPLRHLPGFISGAERYGVDRTRDGRWVAAGSALLGGKDIVPDAMDLLGEVSFDRVVDLGCGNARFLLALCDRFDADGVGVDVSPEACKAANEAIEAAGMADRVEVVVGDAVDLDAVPRMDETQLVVTFFLLHEISSQSREKLIAFLSDIASRLPSGAHLLTAEVEPAARHAGEERFTPEFDFVHAMMRQSLLTEEDWRSAFAEGDFQVTKVVRPQMPGSLLLLARKSD